MNEAASGVLGGVKDSTAGNFCRKRHKPS